eukprot:CAMPEP_0206028862 /NCGR_PEP_ID=MMETSP1464-20131121/45727_1 /ASSEMBLY_ACC=CAM_ASM_001124 /TAXON_ID=119497 /ORGANISM="Exanthemachrysis gayraliae, Strain RCC1523" /LENGTH=255 /DNA_ID=CAMNT_0053402935 /DNA_START=217 /DNA_END=983 /DNA_ORIENTATION=-
MLVASAQGRGLGTAACSLVSTSMGSAGTAARSSDAVRAAGQPEPVARHKGARPSPRQAPESDGVKDIAAALASGAPAQLGAKPAILPEVRRAEADPTNTARQTPGRGARAPANSGAQLVSPRRSRVIESACAHRPSRARAPQGGAGGGLTGSRELATVASRGRLTSAAPGRPGAPLLRTRLLDGGAASGGRTGDRARSPAFYVALMAAGASARAKAGVPRPSRAVQTDPWGAARHNHLTRGGARAARGGGGAGAA